MMRNKTYKILLISLLSLSLAACGETKQSSSDSSYPSFSDHLSSGSDSADSLPKLAADFLSNLSQINEVTLESKDQLNLCLMLYKALEEYSATLASREEIAAGKALLDTYFATYNQLKDDFESKQEIQALADAFLEQMNAIPSADLITLEDYESLQSARKAYEQLNASLQALPTVQEAKEKLDMAFTQYEKISAMTQEEYQIYKFVSSVSLLPDLSVITVSDIESIESILALYNQLTADHKNLEEVKEAYETFAAYQMRCNELKLSLEHAEAFMTKAFSLPSSGSLKWQNSEQKSQIDQALAAYEALTEEEKQIPGVSDAYQELLSVKAAFESLLEPYAVSRLAYGWNFQTGELIFTSGRDPISVLTSNYGLTTANLKENVIVYLDLYYEAGAVIGNMLYSFDITENYRITVSDVQRVLSQLRDEGNGKAISGAGYNFTIHIVSLNEQYASSEYTNFFGGQKISF